MFFGQKLKEIRLKQGFGLRKFADLINIKATELSNIEHGYIEPPQEPQWLYDLVDTLNLESRSTEEMQLFYSWTEPFVMQEMPEFVPAFVCSKDNAPITEEKMVEFMEWMNSKIDEHNKKAREYNNGK